MKQYFYLFNYPPEEYDLCALEFKYLFHEEYQQCFITNKDIDVNISVFMKGKIDIWAISSNFDDLKEEVKRQNHNYQDFKVIYLKNPISHPDYQETLDKCYNVYYQLKNEDYIENEEEIDVYVEKIRENKQQYQNDFYFGAYRIRNNEVELIKNSIKEIYRFCVKNK